MESLHKSFMAECHENAVLS